MRGIIVTNGYYETEASACQAKRLEEELNRLNLNAEIYKNNKPRMLSFADLDCNYAVYFDKDIYLARKLEKDGVRVFNCAKAIEDTDDKIKTAIELMSAGLPCPEVIPSPKRYDGGVDENFLFGVGESLKYPLVVKAAEGSLGMDVYLAKDYAELCRLDAGISCKNRFYQRYVPSDGGESIRVIVIGGVAVCAMRLKNLSDFRSNAAVGGMAHKENLAPEAAYLAERAAKVFKLDYCGVDLFKDGKSIIEINSNAYFKTMEETTGFNVAKAYAEHILKVMRE